MAKKVNRSEVLKMLGLGSESDNSGQTGRQPAGQQTIRTFEHQTDGTFKEGKSFTMDWDALNRDRAEGLRIQTSINQIASLRTKYAKLVEALNAYKTAYFPAHFDESDNWHLAQVTRTIRTKGGIGFEKGDWVLVLEDHKDRSWNKTGYPAFSAYSFRSCSNHLILGDSIAFAADCSYLD